MQGLSFSRVVLNLILNSPYYCTIMARGDIPPLLRFFMQNWLFIVAGLIGLTCLWLLVLGKIDGEKFIGILSALTAFVAVLKSKS